MEVETELTAMEDRPNWSESLQSNIKRSLKRSPFEPIWMKGLRLFNLTQPKKIE